MNATLSGVTRAAPLAVQHWSVPARLGLLVFGLFLYGLSLRMMLDAHVGLAPWEAFHQGVTRVVPLSIGVVSILTGGVIVALTWLILKERPGLGTLMNVVGIGFFLDLLAPLVPDPTALPARWSQFVLGVVLLGLATGTYVAAGLGAGPRDGLVLGLARRRGWRVAPLRSGIELLVLLLGWRLGGQVGLGTLVFAVGVGPSMALGLRLFGLGQPQRPAEPEG